MKILAAILDAIQVFCVGFAFVAILGAIYILRTT